MQKRQLEKSTSFVASLRDQIEAMNCSLVCSLPVRRHSATSNRRVTGSIHGHARTQPTGTVGGPSVSFYRPVLSSVTLSPAQKGVEKVQSNRAHTASVIKTIGQEATKLEAAIQLEKQAAAPAIQLVADIAEIETKLQKRIRELQAQDVNSTFCSCSILASSFVWILGVVNAGRKEIGEIDTLIQEHSRRILSREARLATEKASIGFLVRSCTA